MRSPFPGMDPFLETRWMNAHAHLISSIATTLNQQLPSDLVAFVEERVSIEPDDDRTVRPDVAVRSHYDGPAASPGSEPEAEAGEAVVGLLRVVVRNDPVFEHFVRVAEPKSDRTIVVVELVSPTNKVGEGMRDFRSKRASLLEGGAHFVEIDLTRRGNWKSLLLPHFLRRETQTTYRYITRLTNDPAAVHVRPFGLRDPLPDVRIPLREGEKPATVPLRALLDEVYRSTRAARRIDYSAQLDPPLSPEDADWAKTLIASRPA